LEAIQDENISKALDIYIHGYPKNPSRNRQTLYVLGFRGPRHHDTVAGNLSVPVIVFRVTSAVIVVGLV